MRVLAGLAFVHSFQAAIATASVSFLDISGAQMLPVLPGIIKVAQASIQLSEQASGRFG
jgi:hypothetical protein